ncbi:hypothetical protein RHGRI_031729 [Rhododendron griersonianum]|uniref:protein-serine/threonine phosphatase n=1 Tax=Rhododendron griersonianum TaxID=479676 RepID=A0AAV6IC28_9ERIC|nr:hypothetical protein RHGRI_031729 [Rhododendron griersonianum]
MLAEEEIARLRNKESLRDKKLHLVLDLDHTLLNLTLLKDTTPGEDYLLQDISNGRLFRLDSIKMLTKLRPYVRIFLEEASQLFDMYIYTMGERSYALEIAR